MAIPIQRMEKNRLKICCLSEGSSQSFSFIAISVPFPFRPLGGGDFPGRTGEFPVYYIVKAGRKQCVKIKIMLKSFG